MIEVFIMKIICRLSKKSNSKYYVLVLNGVYVSFDMAIIEKVAMTNGISNIDLHLMNVDDDIIIKEV